MAVKGNYFDESRIYIQSMALPYTEHYGSQAVDVKACLVVCDRQALVCAQVSW
jgi:hypothetical protein